MLAVGATLNRPKGDPVMTASFSSRGPCADGRIKPDIASPGDSVTSTRSTMVAGDKTPYEPYTSMSGTSMSCPLTAGAVALMREWLVDRMGFSNAPPTAALMKAVITGGAKDAATPGNEQGWGRTDLAETLVPSNRAVKLIDRIPFADGDEFAWIVETKEDAPLDVQLAWVDYPGVASGDQSAPRLINDLDLTVSPLQGDELHYGNGRDEPDSLNNIESVRLASVGKGRYLVTVSCKDIVWDHTEGGAAALYIRGAFDPDEVVERYTVRIVKSPETTNTYARLDKALNEAEDGDVIEILDETELRESVVLTNDFALTVVATNANPRASVIGRRKSADILVRKGSLTFTNVAFRTENTTPVRVAGDGVVRVAGIAVFDDIVSGTPGVLTDRPEGFELVGVLENGITVDCTGASAAGAQFGVYRCAAAAAAESARRMISSYGKRRAGVAEGADGSGILKWEDDAPVDPAVAVGYVNGSKKVYYRTLDDLFDEHPSGTKVVVTKSGIVLEKPRTLSGVRSISAEAGAGEIVIFPGASAGFTLGAGCALSVSGITFRDYVGNGLFVVNGEGAKLDVANSVFLDIEGTNKWSGAITVRKGKAIVRDSTFDNCQATGQYRGNKTVKSHGGAIYLAGAGCELELKGGLITGCFAKTYGGGVYAAGGSSVGVRGALTVRGNWSGNNKANDDIHLQNTNAVLTLTGKLEGEDAVGVRYGASGLDKGNDIGKRFAAVSNGVDRETAISSEKAFFNDTDPVGIRADIDEDSANLLWAKRTDGDRWVDPEDPDAAVRVTKGCVTHYYIEPEYAFGWIDADAAVELLRNVDFGDDLVVTNGVKVTMVSKNDGPFTLSRSSDVLIRVLSGASLAISNLTISGNAAVGSSGLIKVRGGSLDLRAGVTIRDVWGAADRASSAISVQTNGTVTLRSGARVVDCMNGYVNRGSKAGYGGGLLVEDHSTANLLGGSIVECCANRGGGVFIGTKSEIGISGDVRIADNLGALGDDNLCVSDLSQAKVTLTGPLTGAIGYNEGRSGDTNVFGKVASSFDGTDADKQASAHRFTHDFTGDVGMAVSDGSETLLVWGNALDENGKYGEYELLDGDPYAVAVPVGHVREYDGTCQTGVDEGVGYMVVSGNAATNIGAYTAIVTTRPGFAWTDGSTGDANVAWSITRARYVLTGVTLEDRTFVYDGTYKTLEITGALPDGLSVKYENNVRWQPGTNDVTACISGSIPNYEPDPFVTNLYAKLIIIDPEGLFKGEDNPPGPIPTVVTNWPTPIAFQSITRFADTNWVLVVTNRVPWCWYRLIYTDDLAAGFTKTGRWERVTAEDGQVWTTNVIFSAEESAPAFFWRAEGAWGIVGQEPGIDPDHR